jgi:hypothetical protein
MTAILRASLVALASFSVVAHGQTNVAPVPSAAGPVHPGTAILDAMGIVAGAPVLASRPVHPGTAILDQMGIFAGLPVPDAPNGNTVAVTAVIPK